MSDTLVVRFNEESKQSDLNSNAEEDEDDDILDKLGIPALSEIDTAQKDGNDEGESKNKLKRSLNKVFKEALEVIKSIKNKEFSRDPDFLELQIMKAEKKLNEFSKVIWEKLDLTCYKDPSDYYTMIRMAKGVFSRDLKDLMEKEKNIKNHELSKDIFELYTEKFITEGKLIDIKDKLDNSRGKYIFVIKKLVTFNNL